VKSATSVKGQKLTISLLVFVAAFNR
jgi:hypothetical protein